MLPAREFIESVKKAIYSKRLVYFLQGFTVVNKKENKLYSDRVILSVDVGNICFDERYKAADEFLATTSEEADQFGVLISIGSIQSYNTQEHAKKEKELFSKYDFIQGHKICEDDEILYGERKSFWKDQWLRYPKTKIKSVAKGRFAKIKNYDEQERERNTENEVKTFRTPTFEDCFECKRHCCFYAYFTKEELDNVLKKWKLHLNAEIKEVEEGYLVVRPSSRGTLCGFYKDHKCSIYPDRPKICSDFGVEPDGYLCYEVNLLDDTLDKYIQKVEDEVYGRRLKVRDLLARGFVPIEGKRKK